jgi:uncharacterized protein (DUF58 family)
MSPRSLRRALPAARSWLVRRVPLLASITHLGWVLTVIGLVSWVAAAALDWREAAVVAAACLVALAASLLFTLGKSNYDVVIDLQPQRVSVGERAGVQVVVANSSGRRQLPGRMELVVGMGRAAFTVPSLADGERFDELYTVPTHRRAIVQVGPVSSVRGDPIGLCRRERQWTGVEQLYVHPKISPLDRLGSGFLKDLEGQTTQDLSNSDVAFHTLREYVPGDDRRHIHWKTTARVGTMMVRQFVDTRRSHLALVISTDQADYASEDEFELALSLGASLGVRTLLDEQTVAVVAGRHSLPSENTPRLLDAFSGIERSDAADGLLSAVMEANRTAGTPSIVAFVTGSRRTIADVRLAANRLTSDARVVVVRADEAGELAYRPVGTTAMINVPALEEFARGLWRASQL